MPTGNHIATPKEFHSAYECDRRARAERVVLPKSGLAMLLARPSTRWFLFQQRLPMSLAVRAQGAVAAMSSSPGRGETPLEKIEEARELAEWVVALLEKTVVAPRLSLDPGPDEVSPDWLPAEDVDFIIRYAVGEVAPLTSAPSSLGRGERGEGCDLAAFRRERKSAARGAGGGDVSRLALGPSRDGPDGFSD